MTAAEFKQKWARYTGKESAAYQEHFTDLCRLLNHPTPAAADPTGSESFCFQKRVVKDAELFALKEDGSAADAEEARRGFADVWKRDCFGWEYKGKKKSLTEAHKQLLLYREALLNPPLLVVCDLDLAHKKLDDAVAAAYGWPADLSDGQILEKLLALNLERAAEEQQASRATRPKTSRERRAEEMI